MRDRDLMGRVRDRMAAARVLGARRRARSGIPGERDLEALTLRGDLEDLRRAVHATADPAGRGRRHARSGDVAFARAVLLAVHASVTAQARLETTADGAGRRLVVAAVRRLLVAGRSRSAWSVVQRRRDVLMPTATLLRLARDLDDPEDLRRMRAAIEEGQVRIRRNRAHVAAQAATSLGRIAFLRGRFDEAHATLLDAEGMEPSATTATWLGRVALELGRPDEARRFAEVARVRTRGHPGAVLIEARLAADSGDEDVARRGWMHVVHDSAATADEMFECWEGLGSIACHADQVVAADRLIAATRGQPLTRAARSVALWHSGNRVDADRELEDLQSQFSALEIRALAFYLGRTGRSPEAYEVLGSLTPQVRGATASAELVRALLQDGHVRLATQCAAHALTVHPEDHGLRVARAQAMETALPSKATSPVEAS